MMQSSHHQLTVVCECLVKSLFITLQPVGLQDIRGRRLEKAWGGLNVMGSVL